MSSPVHFDEHTEPAIMYAPSGARKPISCAPTDAVVVSNRSSERGSKRNGPKLEFSGDRAMLDIQRQLVRNPDLIPEPVAESRPIAAPIVVRLCGVLGLATLIAWSMVCYSETLGGAPAVSADGASLAEPIDKAASIASSEGFGRGDASPAQTPAAAPVQENIASAVPENAASVATSASLSAPQNVASTTSPSSSPLAITPDLGAAVSMPIPAPQNIKSPPTDQENEPVVSRLDADEVETLLKRGKDLLADGDLVSARVLLRRAAESANAEAALVLGTTYDPLVIQRLGVLGAHPDIDQARGWYQRAAELGSNSASQRLAGLVAAP
jgi:hypothetical protein